LATPERNGGFLDTNAANSAGGAGKIQLAWFKFIFTIDAADS
jgi:hypothetical protein